MVYLFRTKNLKLKAFFVLYVLVSYQCQSIFAEVKSEAEFGLQHSQFLSQNFTESQSKNLTRLNLNYHFKSLQKKHNFILQIGGAYSINNYHEDHFWLPELYHEIKSLRPVSLVIGRKIYDWSESDRFFQLGQWGALFASNPLRSHIQGLPGVFLNIEQETWQVQLMASPLFLPHQGPRFVTENGKIKSQSRWFNPAPLEFAVGHKSVEIEYKLMRPSINQVIDQPNIAFRSRWGRVDKGPWGALSYAYKPMNDFNLAFETRQTLNLENKKMKVVIHPQVHYHHLAALEAGMKQRKLSFWGSLSLDKPMEKELDESWEQIPLEEFVVASTGLKVQLPAQVLKRSDLKLGYLKTWKKRVVTKRESLVSDEATSSLSRYKWQHIAVASLNTVLMDHHHQQLRMSAKYTYAFDEQAIWLTTRLEYQQNKRLTYSLGADVLGTNNNKRGYLSSFQANDQVYGGIRYAF